MLVEPPPFPLQVASRTKLEKQCKLRREVFEARNKAEQSKWRGKGLLLWIGSNKNNVVIDIRVLSRILPSVLKRVHFFLPHGLAYDSKYVSEYMVFVKISQADLNSCSNDKKCKEATNRLASCYMRCSNQCCLSCYTTGTIYLLTLPITTITV